jgi:hypothetical protein
VPHDEGSESDAIDVLGSLDSEGCGDSVEVLGDGSVDDVGNASGVGVGVVVGSSSTGVPICHDSSSPAALHGQWTRGPGGCTLWGFDRFLG